MNPIQPPLPRVDAAPAVNTPRSPTVEVHIDALVFHGLSRPESRRASAAFQAELVRLLASGRLAAGTELPPLDQSHVDAGTIRAHPAQAELTGRLAAQAVFERLTL